MSQAFDINERYLDKACSYCSPETSKIRGQFETGSEKIDRLMQAGVVLMIPYLLTGWAFSFNLIAKGMGLEGL